jgi:outer membrane lipopolysaccharide assembly protein LptE/RlpB
MKKILQAGLLLCASLLFWTCGYQFEGGGYLNRNIKEVGVRVAENTSNESGAEAVFTNALISEIVRKTDTSLVDVSIAPVILELKIKAINFGTVARTDQTSVNERRVSAVVDVLMFSREGEEIWAANDLSLDESYLVSSDTGIDDAHKRTALEKIAARTAESLVSRMLSDF